MRFSPFEARACLDDAVAFACQVVAQLGTDGFRIVDDQDGGHVMPAGFAVQFKRGRMSRLRHAKVIRFPAVLFGCVESAVGPVHEVVERFAGGGVRRRRR